MGDCDTLSGYVHDGEKVESWGGNDLSTSIYI